jgi:Family of unknown function (DUF6319)
MAQLVSLSDEDLARLRSELAEGRPPMVWFTSAAVGVPAGGSAKVVAFDEPAEGDFIQVRPTGSKDVLSFSPSELTTTRPPRRKAAPKPPAAKPAARPAAAVQRPEPAAPAAPRPAAPAPAKASVPRPTTAKPASPRRGPKAAPRPAAEVTVTLHSSPEGEWTVEVVVGKKRTVRPTPVGPGEVAKAARALPAAVAEAVDRALDSARRTQQERVAALQAQLEAAQRALKDLG